MNTLDQKIKELSEAIRASRQWQVYQKANQAFQNDKEAKQLLNDFQMAQQTLAIFQQGGFPGQEEQREKVEELLKQVRQNKIIKEWIQSQRDMQILIENLAANISREINFPFSPLQSSGGCCG